MIRDDINAAKIAAMKGGDKETVGTLRLVQASILNRDIEARTGGAPKDDDTLVTEVLQKMVKQRRKSADIYRKNNRDDRAEVEEAEIAVIERFLPQQLSDADAETKIREIVAETGASSMKDMGRVMALVKERLGGSIEPARASGLVKTALSLSSGKRPRRAEAAEPETKDRKLSCRGGRGSGVRCAGQADHAVHRQMVQANGDHGSERTGHRQLEIERHRVELRADTRDVSRGPRRQSARRSGHGRHKQSVFSRRQPGNKAKHNKRQWHIHHVQSHEPGHDREDYGDSAGQPADFHQHIEPLPCCPASSDLASLRVGTETIYLQSAAVAVLIIRAVDKSVLAACRGPIRA